MLPHAPGGILALDLSSQVGWAYARPGGPPLSGVWSLRGGTRGERFQAFENELIRAMGERVPRLVIMEAPLPSKAQKSDNAARQALGLAAYVESETSRAGCQCREGQVNQVRKDVLGRGNLGPTEQAKATVMAWCRERGWNPPDNNAADACILWQYACNVWMRKGVILHQDEESGQARALF